MIITDSQFYSNDADYEGGEIYTSYVAVDIFDSTFRDNSVSDSISYGGACSFDMGNVTFMNNIFENNTGSIVSTIYAYDTRGKNSNYNYKVQVLTSAGTPLNNIQIPVSVNNKMKNYTTGALGYVTIPFTKLTAQQTIIVVNPSNADNKKTKIMVKSRFASASNVAMYYFDGSKFKARIVGDDGKYIGKGQIVTIKLN